MASVLSPADSSTAVCVPCLDWAFLFAVMVLQALHHGRRLLLRTRLSLLLSLNLAMTILSGGGVALVLIGRMRAFAPRRRLLFELYLRFFFQQGPSGAVVTCCAAGCLLHPLFALLFCLGAHLYKSL